MKRSTRQRRRERRALKKLRRLERRIDHLRWKHVWLDWLMRIDRNRRIFREREEEEERRRKKMTADELAGFLVEHANVQFTLESGRKGCYRVLVLEGTPSLRAALDVFNSEEIFYGVAQDKRSVGTYDRVIIGTQAAPHQVIEAFYQPFSDAQGHKKFFNQGRLVAMVHADQMEVGVRVNDPHIAREWMPFNEWITTLGGETIALRGVHKVMVILNKIHKPVPATMTT